MTPLIRQYHIANGSKQVENWEWSVLTLSALCLSCYILIYEKQNYKNISFNFRAVIYFILFGTDSVPFLFLHCTSPLMHSCSHDPEQIRAEVEYLRQDFNQRVKKILCNSIFGAYYSSFVPCCFAQVGLVY